MHNDDVPDESPILVLQLLANIAYELKAGSSQRKDVDRYGVKYRGISKEEVVVSGACF